MDNARTYFEVLKWASSFLKENQQEAVIAEYLLLEYNKWSKTDLLMNFKTTMSVAMRDRFKADLVKIVEHYPPQYLIGDVSFYDRCFTVTEATLIPRPETEELVALCLADLGDEALTLIDVGTGTGAIGLTLKKERPNWQVTVSDISEEALSVAQDNGEQLGAKVTYVLGNTLEPVLNQLFDVIISNPPYIDIDEWPEMDESVRSFEPKTALFAEEKGLSVYKKLAQESPKILTESGRIYLEIGYRQGEAVSKLFQDAFPNKKVEVIQDMSGLDRIIKVY